MSLDIFNELNTLRTDPGFYNDFSSFEAQEVTALYVDEGPQKPFTWSNTLMRAAIEYINDKGPDGKSSYSSAANVA